MKPKHPLLLLLLDLLLRHFDLRHFDPHFGHRGFNTQHDLRHNESLSRTQGAIKFVSRETWRRNREMKGPGRDIGKGELPIVAGQYFLRWGLVFARELHLSTGGGGPGLNNHRSADVAWQLPIWLLLAGGCSCCPARQVCQFLLPGWSGAAETEPPPVSEIRRAAHIGLARSNLQRRGPTPGRFGAKTSCRSLLSQHAQLLPSPNSESYHALSGGLHPSGHCRWAGPEPTPARSRRCAVGRRAQELLHASRGCRWRSSRAFSREARWKCSFTRCRPNSSRLYAASTTPRETSSSEAPGCRATNGAS